jgi:sterol desaturase/sphingolipid hydroxylase (fatty acid hydroxylase superfamily)
MPPSAPQLAPASQTACYSPWLKVRVLIRAALTLPWSPEDWPLRTLRTSHRIHHQFPEWNFGVTMRLWDLVFGTRYRKPKLQA